MRQSPRNMPSEEGDRIIQKKRQQALKTLKSLGEIVPEVMAVFSLQSEPDFPKHEARPIFWEEEQSEWRVIPKKGVVVKFEKIVDRRKEVSDLIKKLEDLKRYLVPEIRDRADQLIQMGELYLGNEYIFLKRRLSLEIKPSQSVTYGELVDVASTLNVDTEMIKDQLGLTEKDKRDLPNGAWRNETLLVGRHIFITETGWRTQ